MKTKTWIRILSTILSILFVLEILPISVMAEEYNEYKDLSNAELSTQQEEKSPIVSEVVSERDAFKKVFEREDGSFTAIISSGPVHYFEDGEWLEIDNTLIETNGTITNESNGFSVDLPSEITSDKNVTIANENAELSFTMENISSSAAEITEIEPVDDETSLMMGLDNIASSVEYTSVMTNTDLVYDIGADSVKESIILSSCPSQATDYSYTINSNGATLYLNEDNSINVVNNGQIEFVIEAPYMFDSNGISTDDIDVSLENIGESTYTLTYSPDYDWLSSEERAYPVTIDPTTTVYSATAISEAFIGAVSSTATDLDKFHYLGADNKLYFKYSDSTSANFGKNSVITNAEFSLYCEALTDDDILGVYPITSTWNEPAEEETIEPVAESTDLLDYNVIVYGESAKRYVWDITEVAAKWQMNQTNNYGIVVKPYSDSSINTKIYRSSTANYTTRRPWFQIDYVTIDNMAEYDTETVDMGRAGTLYLNKYTGTYYVKRTDLSLNGNVSPVEMSFTYDPWSSSVTRGSSYGAYWITDYYNKIFYSQTVTENDITRHQYTFRDNGGIKTRFVEVVSTDEDYNTVPEGFTESYRTNYTRYKAVSGDLSKCLWVPKSDTTYKDFANMIIEDSTYRYTIDSINRITSRVHKTSGAVIAIEHRTASSDAIRSVTDGVGRKYDLPSAYDTNGKVITDKLVLYNSSNEAIKVSTLTGDVAIGVDYGYTAIDDATSHLTTVTYADGEAITYEYNTDGLMTSVTNVDGSRLELRYSGDRVIGYTKYAYYVSAGNSQNCFESQLDINFDGPKQRTFTYYEYDKTTPSIVTKQRYDASLQTTDYINTNGEYGYIKPISTGTKENVNYSSNDDDATNLIVNGKFESGKTGWISVADNASIGLPVLSEPYAFDGVSGKMISLNSGLRKNLRVGQTIASLPTNEETVYTLSAWAQTLSSVTTSYTNNHEHLNKTFAICVTNNEGNVIAQYDFDTTTDEWQFGAVSFKTDTVLENVKVILMADGQCYPVRFDDVKLFESDYGYVYSEEEISFETQSTENLIIAEDGITYRTEPCEHCSCAQCTEVKTITYNDIATEVYYNCNCGKENVECNCLGCRQERGSITQSNEKYDLPLSQTLSNGTKILASAYTYSSNSNYLASSSESGAVSYYNYNPDTGNLDEYGTQTSSNGEIINPVVYSYNAVGALTQVKQLVTDLSDGEGTLNLETNYTYANDRITSVSHGGTTYAFDYDHYGNLVSTSVNGNTIVSHSYPDHKNVGAITYANGLVIGYTYDADGNITSIKHNGVEKYAYEYTDSTLSKSVDYINSLVTYYTEETTTVKFFSLATGAIVDGETIYCYNTENLTETVFGVTFTYSEEKQSYNSTNDTVDKTNTVSFAVNEILSTETVDFFDRVINENFTLKIDSAVNTTASTIYTYDDTDTTASNRIIGVENKLADTTVSNYTYSYDASGNITEVRNNGTLLYKYEYDEAGQIAKDYNFATSTATTFVYDANGNILSKTPYTNVTSADLSTAIAGTPITYAYDTNWTDKLTSYNGQDIVYDAIGNPTTYRGATLTWNGRLLTSYEKGEDRFEYTYNENGLRTSKKHYDNGIYNLTYHYLWQNSKLYGAKVTFAEDREPLVLNYLYDGDEVIGVYLNDRILLYIKNLQGDIVSVVNTENNEIVLNYYYDAWGNISYEASESNVGAVMAILVLAATNFSYRGYFCDYETGLYYLQSRYYDPEVGRFINLDDTGIVMGSTGDVLGSNLFAYCFNNPANCVDYTGYYSYKKALEYAKKWWNGRNTSQYKSNTYDCANFVSQCLYAGSYSKMTGVGTAGWHHIKIKIKSYIKFQISNAWGIANNLYKWLTKTQKCQVKSFNYKKCNEGEFREFLRCAGSFSDCRSVIFFKRINSTEYNHAAISGKYKSTERNLYYYAHSGNRNGDGTKSDASLYAQLVKRVTKDDHESLQKYIGKYYYKEICFVKLV